MRKGARYRDSLLLAAGELGREALIHAFQGDEAQEFLAAFAALRGSDAADPEGEFDVLRDSHVAEEGVVLEDQAYAAASGSYVGYVTAVEGDAAVVYA
jgi:hypothetical protein